MFLIKNDLFFSGGHIQARPIKVLRAPTKDLLVSEKKEKNIHTKKTEKCLVTANTQPTMPSVTASMVRKVDLFSLKTRETILFTSAIIKVCKIIEPFRQIKQELKTYLRENIL